MQLFCCPKEHISWFVSAGTTVCKIEVAVGLRNVLRGGVLEKSGDAIYGGPTAFEFQKGTNGGLVELNFQVPEAWKSVGGPEFFILEQWTQAQGGQDSAHLFAVGDCDFDFLSDFVTILLFRPVDCGPSARCALGRAFICQYGLGGRRAVLSADSRGRLLDADANELSAAGQILLRSVIERVEFMGARGDQSRVELVQATAQCGDVCHGELDLDFVIGFTFHGMSGGTKKLHLKPDI
jgi:hypothetical protein